MWRRTSSAPTSAWNVLPAAITTAARIDPSMVMFAAKLPTNTPGHSRFPPRSSAASAIPDPGQIAVA